MNVDRRNLHKLESLGSEAFTIERKREDVENVDEDERKRKSVKKIDNMLAKELTRETDESDHKAPVMCHCAECMCKIPIIGSILKCICYGVCVNKYYVGWFRDCTDPRFWIRYFFMKVMELSLSLIQSDAADERFVV